MPTSEVLFRDFVEDGVMDSITRSEIQTVLSPYPVGGKFRYINPIDTWKGWQGLGFDNQYDWMLKLTYRFNPNMKLGVTGAMDQRYSQSNSYHAGYYYVLKNSCQEKGYNNGHIW